MTDTLQRLELLEACVEHMRDAIVILEQGADPRHPPRILFVNHALLTRLNTTREALIGKPATVLPAVSSDPAVHARVRKAHMARTPFHERICRPTPDGGMRWIELDIVPISGRDGASSYSLSTSRDITEAKAADDARRASEERFQLVALATNDAIWDWDMRSGRITHNEGLTRAFGHAPDDVVHVEHWLARIHPEDQPRLARIAPKLMEDPSDRLFTLEYRFQRSDGRYAWVLDRGQVLLDASGQVERIVGCMSDITVRREAEERIRHQAALLDGARDAILVRDLEDRVTYWNRSAERLYGWSAAEAIGRSIAGLIYRDPSDFHAANREVFERGEWLGEIRQVTRDGAELVVEGRWTLVRDEGGRPHSVLVINTDITEKKRLELQFLRAQRLESIGTLAGGIAHDLNNVLAPILMAIELLELTETNPQRRDVLTNMQVSARRGAEMVRQVLAFARGVDGERVMVEPRELAREVARMLAEMLPKDITLDVAVAPDAWCAIGDATQLHQVLVNLCVNARDAMPDGGRLTIAIDNQRLDDSASRLDPQARAGAFIRMSVSDNGTGMTEAVQRRLFEPFFTTKPHGRGTGLGLATVQAIVKSHGGWVSVYSEPGRGSTFRAHLPADPTSIASARAPITPQLPRGQGELVLLVDDEPTIRQVGRQTLEAFGYRVLVAAEGSEAVALFAQNLGDVAAVVTDMMMPHMDGAATIRALRHIQPDVCVIATSGFAQSGGTTRAAGMGVSWFLAKPYTTESLLVTLRAAIESRAA